MTTHQNLADRLKLLIEGDPALTRADQHAAIADLQKFERADWVPDFVAKALAQTSHLTGQHAVDFIRQYLRLVTPAQGQQGGEHGRE